MAEEVTVRCTVLWVTGMSFARSGSLIARPFSDFTALRSSPSEGRTEFAHYSVRRGSSKFCILIRGEFWCSSSQIFLGSLCLQLSSIASLRSRSSSRSGVALICGFCFVQFRNYWCSVLFDICSVLGLVVHVMVPVLADFDQFLVPELCSG